MEQIVLILFCCLLLAGVAFGIPTTLALLAGLFLFYIYGVVRAYRLPRLLEMSLHGLRTAGTVILTMLMVGVLTAMWRACGTIAVIIADTAWLIRPSSYLLLTFLLNAALSVLTGTSFGTAGTMGVICMAIGNTLGVSPILAGGAILSGAFVGDRCSPVSTSAILVSTLTGSDLFRNLRNMIRTSVLPFLLTCVVYLVLGQGQAGTAVPPDVRTLFSTEYVLHPLCLLPALAVLALSILRLPVMLSMGISSLLSFVLGILIQGKGVTELLQAALFGFSANSKEVADMLNGGGIKSMVDTVLIVAIASCYAGIFEETGLVKGLKSGIEWLGQKTNAFLSCLLTSLLTSAISCNQTLAIMLNSHLCQDLGKSPEENAINLEDSVVLTAGLIPWSIAGAVPLATVGAPITALAAASYLYLLPLCHLFLSVFGKGRFRMKW